MDTKLHEIIGRYKCCICGRPLSVPPIIILNVTNDTELYKCGRCKWIIVGTTRWSRNRFFEEVAQNLSFPCSYLPCPRRIPQSEVEEHEGICPFRTIRCPLHDNCSKNILVDTISEHFKDKHKQVDIRKVDTMESSWEVSSNTNNMFFLQVDNQGFFIYILEEGRIAVLATRRSKYTKFNVKLRFRSEDNFVVCFDDLPVILYDDKYHCFMCIEDICNENHTNMEHIESNQIDSNHFTSDLKNDLTYSLMYKNKIRYYITMIPDETITEDPDQITEEECKNEEVKISPSINMEVLRRALTCPYCLTYISAPIITCTNGHTVCSTCKLRLQKCPLCQGSLNGPRNYVLEDIASDVKMSCQFCFNGCTFSGNALDMRNHEMECLFSDMDKSNV